MASSNILDVLYSKNLSPLSFDWDSLRCRPLLSIISQSQIDYIRSIILDPRYVSKPDKRRKIIDQVMYSIGFKRYVEGTNRVCYISLDDNSIVIKVAKEKVGMRDSPMEFKNQNILKPFVCKCFEVTPCGTIGLFERVDPITSISEFVSISEDVFDLLNKYIDGRYILDDIGSNYFLNYGIRKGFGPVLLDYPYMYLLDGNKLYCNNPDPTSPTGRCEGLIDYDIGFNNLLCEKCGKRYLPIELKKEIEQGEIIIKGKGEYKMKVKIMRGNELEYSYYIGEPKKVEHIPTKVENIPSPMTTPLNEDNRVKEILEGLSESISQNVEIEDTETIPNPTDINEDEIVDQIKEEINDSDDNTIDDSNEEEYNESLIGTISEPVMFTSNDKVENEDVKSNKLNLDNEYVDKNVLDEY